MAFGTPESAAPPARSSLGFRWKHRIPSQDPAALASAGRQAGRQAGADALLGRLTSWLLSSLLSHLPHCSPARQLAHAAGLWPHAAGLWQGSPQLASHTSRGPSVPPRGSTLTDRACCQFCSRERCNCHTEGGRAPRGAPPQLQQVPRQAGCTPTPHLILHNRVHHVPGHVQQLAIGHQQRRRCARARRQDWAAASKKGRTVFLPVGSCRRGLLPPAGIAEWPGALSGNSRASPAVPTLPARWCRGSACAARLLLAARVRCGCWLRRAVPAGQVGRAEGPLPQPRGS